MYFKLNCVDRNILRGPLSVGAIHCVDIFSALSAPSAHLETLSDQLGHLTVLRVLLSADDEVDEALGVPQHGGGVGLGHSDQAGAVHLETGKCHVRWQC